MVFIIITFVLSFISIFIRAGKTKLYKQALILLEERNNGTFDYPGTNCRKGGYIFKDKTYCEYDGVMLKNQTQMLAIKVYLKIGKQLN